MNRRHKQLTILLNTANEWSSDQKGNGLAMLSLGTTRRIHSTDHRRECVAEIDANIEYAKSLPPGEYNDDDVTRLYDLRRQVEKAKIGVEWLTDQQYVQFANVLHAQEKN